MLPHHLDHRERGRRRDPAGHLPAGACRRRYGGRFRSRDQRRPPGVFAMQYGPGSENAFPGIATTYRTGCPCCSCRWRRRAISRRSSRFSVQPHLCLGHQAGGGNGPACDHVRDAPRLQRIEERPAGPVMVEVPRDIVDLDAGDEAEWYSAVCPLPSVPDASDIDEAAKTLLAAPCPVILAGQGVLYAEASAELVELAELLQAPVMTTVDGKSAFPEDHALALGSGGNTFTGPGRLFLYTKADLIFGIGCGFTQHPLTTPPLPAGVPIIHATNDPRDLHKSASDRGRRCSATRRLTLAGLIVAVKDRLGRQAAEQVAGGRNRGGAGCLARPLARQAWQFRNADHAVPCHVGVHPGYRSCRGDRDPRFRQSPRSVSAVLSRDPPRGYLGWGKSHQLGTGPWLDHWREGRRTGQILRQLHGRCGVRHDRPRPRDRCPRRYTQPDDRPEQQHDGDRDPAHETVARTASRAGSWRQLCQSGDRPRRAGANGSPIPKMSPLRSFGPNGRPRTARPHCWNSSPAPRPRSRTATVPLSDLCHRRYGSGSNVRIGSLIRPLASLTITIAPGA